MNSDSDTAGWIVTNEAPVLTQEARDGDVSALLRDCLAARWKVEVLQPGYPDLIQFCQITATRNRHVDNFTTDETYNSNQSWYVTERRRIKVTGKTLPEACRLLGEACDALRENC